ncbi:MAG: hypothetical protein A2X19_06130 [Bacteroidetes bacterium GWE2_39_28]|nr:MAG: hypothetical protein A2X19_06130 [Bacteroidetes bacterium GWE2_39_28]OFY12821.1 MAG: hypothetical protein A2X16_00910 [Bacteroidetes bacterium GWF2_39_10]OFZ11043.1 MAG: hypothetical protein A2465_00945 [Bacteroidetes bacterium RIFOXYC2_FULL_39_11]HCT93700.1 hypothetical protein [Rikenellaceae bacterium]
MKLKEWIKTKTPFDYLIYVVLTVCIIMIVTYFLNFNGKPSKKLEDWSMFGNYFAAVFGLIAFLGVLYNARQSEIRAKKAEDEMIKREERDQFFKMLDLHYLKGKELNLKGDKKLSFYSISDFAGNTLISYCVIKRFIEYEFDLSRFNSNERTYAEKCYDDLKDELKLVGEGSNMDEKQLLCDSYTSKIEKHYILPKLTYMSRYYFNMIKSNITKEEKYEAYQYSSILILKFYRDYIEPYYNNFNSILDTVPKFKQDEFFMKFLQSQLSSSEQSLLLYYYLGQNVYVDRISSLLKYNMLTQISTSQFHFCESEREVKSNVNKLLKEKYSHTLHKMCSEEN